MYWSGSECRSIEDFGSIGYQLIVDRHGERVDALLLTVGHTGRNAGDWPDIDGYWRGQFIHIEIVVVVVVVKVVHGIHIIDGADRVNGVDGVDVADALKHQTIRVTISFLARRGTNQ